MLRFKTYDSNIPVTPKGWRAPSGYRIAYDSVRETWQQFVGKVMAYCDANGITRPALDWLEDHICNQISSWACIEASQYAARQGVKKSISSDSTSYRKCGACGHK